MDYREKPTWRRPAASCPCCGGPLQLLPGRRSVVLGSSVLLLFATAALGLPLAAPHLTELWIHLNVGFALATALLIAYLAQGPHTRRCSRCGTPDGRQVGSISVRDARRSPDGPGAG
jgi:hypothetical protein